MSKYKQKIEESCQEMDKKIDWMVSCCNEKYTVVHFDKGGGYAFRYDERFEDLTGNNLVIGLALELLEAREGKML